VEVLIKGLKKAAVLTAVGFAFSDSFLNSLLVKDIITAKHKQVFK
jgi:hypothetical protein